MYLRCRSFSSCCRTATFANRDYLYWPKHLSRTDMENSWNQFTNRTSSCVLFRKQMIVRERQQQRNCFQMHEWHSFTFHYPCHSIPFPPIRTPKDLRNYGSPFTVWKWLQFVFFHEVKRRRTMTGRRLRPVSHSEEFVKWGWFFSLNIGRFAEVC